MTYCLQNSCSTAELSRRFLYNFTKFGPLGMALMSARAPAACAAGRRPAERGAKY